MDLGTTVTEHGAVTRHALGRKWPVVLAVVTVLALVLGLVVLKVVQSSSARSVPAANGPDMSADALNRMFAKYGDTSQQWSGGDRTVSLTLPDGRVLWLFADTFLGEVYADRSRDRDAPFIHNSAVIQRGPTLERTLYGGSPEDPSSLVPDEAPGEFYWVGDAIVDGDVVRAVYNRYRTTGPGGLDFALLGSALVTFRLPDVALIDVHPLPVADRIAWGADFLTEGGYTYIYGSEGVGELKFGHVARVPGTDLGAKWEFRTPTGWSTTETESQRLLSGVGMAYGIQKAGNRYLLVTHENNLHFSADIVAYTASSPTGPFEGPTYLFRAPEADDGNIIYDAHVHPELSRPGKLLISYDVNSLLPDKIYTDARIYRSRFIEIDWPLPSADRKALPGQPADLTVAVEAPGSALLNWRAPPDAGHAYRIHRRDVTAGQTHFVRLADSTRETGYTAVALINGHTYEFRVTASNAAGEGIPSNTVSVTATATPRPPPAPVDVRAVAGTAGDITVSWAAGPPSRVYRVMCRDRTAGQKEPVLAGTFSGSSARISPFWHGRTYEFTVVAVGSGGALSQPSAPARATAFFSPPARPTGLRAEPLPRPGDYSLNWDPVPGAAGYWVSMRDVTAGQPALVRFEQPTVGTTAGPLPLVAGHRYEFSVAAYNQGGVGPAAPTVPVTVP